jgi:hypothetical protein
MKNTIAFGIAVVLLLLVCLMWGYQHSAEKRPTVRIHEINTTPEHYICTHPDVMLELESVIRQAYLKDKNMKWKKPYKYVYVIQKSNRWFSRAVYLNFHPEDAVDTRLIFSNRLPDPQLFIILP